MTVFDNKYTDIAIFISSGIFIIGNRFFVNAKRLKKIAYYPGGAMYFENWKINETVPLSECLSYRIKIIKA